MKWLTWGTAGTVYGITTAFAYLVGYARGYRRATRALKRRLQLAGSRFASGDE